MERALQILLFVALIMIGISAALAIRAHYIVWRYAPQLERLPRNRPETPPTE